MSLEAEIESLRRLLHAQQIEKVKAQAERDALRAELGTCASSRFRAEQEYNGVLAERDEARAELAAEQQMREGLEYAVKQFDERVVRLHAERDALRAELAAEREAGQVFLAENEDLRRQRDQADEGKASHQRICMTVMAERDALRELLREMRSADLLLCVEVWRARIDAALAKGGGK